MKLKQSHFTAHFVSNKPMFKYQIVYHSDYLRFNRKSLKCHWVNNTWFYYTNDSDLYDEINFHELSLNRLKQLRHIIRLLGTRALKV